MLTEREKELERIKECFIELWEQVKEGLIAFAESIFKAVLKLPPKIRYKFLKSLNMDKDTIMLFFYRDAENRIKITKQLNIKVEKNLRQKRDEI